MQEGSLRTTELNRISDILKYDWDSFISQTFIGLVELGGAVGIRLRQPPPSGGGRHGRKTCSEQAVKPWDPVGREPCTECQGRYNNCVY